MHNVHTLSNYCLVLWVRPASPRLTKIPDPCWTRLFLGIRIALQMPASVCWSLKLWMVMVTVPWKLRWTASYPDPRHLTRIESTCHWTPVSAPNSSIGCVSCLTLVNLSYIPQNLPSLTGIYIQNILNV